MASPAETLGEFLPSTIVGGSSGWTLYIGNMVTEPDQVVVMYDSGGQNPNPRWAVDFVTVQAMIRARPNSYAAGWAKAREVRDYLLGLDSQVIGSDRYVSVICMGDVGFVGYDDGKRPTFSVNYRIIIEPSVTGNNRDPL